MNFAGDLFGIFLKLQVWIQQKGHVIQWNGCTPDDKSEFKMLQQTHIQSCCIVIKSMANMIQLQY